MIDFLGQLPQLPSRPKTNKETKKLRKLQFNYCVKMRLVYQYICKRIKETGPLFSASALGEDPQKNEWYNQILAQEALRDYNLYRAMKKSGVLEDYPKNNSKLEVSDG